MEEKIRLAVFGQKRLSREGGIEIVVKELCTRMAQNGCDVTCYNRAGHHVSGAEYDKTIEYDGIFKKSDVEDLREKLQDACDHPEMVMKMKKQAADFICEKYNWDEVVKETMKLYRRK